MEVKNLPGGFSFNLTKDIYGKNKGFKHKKRTKDITSVLNKNSLIKIGIFSLK